VRLSLYPEESEKVDELAIDFGTRWEVYRQWFQAVTSNQLAKVDMLTNGFRA
jgi:hypothetical protein